jgi:hypothetical protein
MKINVWVATNRVGSKVEETIEIPDDELAEYPDPKEREQYLQDYARDYVFDGMSMFEWSWEVVED